MSMKAYLHEVWELLAKHVFADYPNLATAVLDEVRLHAVFLLSVLSERQVCANPMSPRQGKTSCTNVCQGHQPSH